MVEEITVDICGLQDPTLTSPTTTTTTTPTTLTSMTTTPIPTTPTTTRPTTTTSTYPPLPPARGKRTSVYRCASLPPTCPIRYTLIPPWFLCTWKWTALHCADYQWPSGLYKSTCLSLLPFQPFIWFDSWFLISNFSLVLLFIFVSCQSNSIKFACKFFSFSSLQMQCPNAY